MNFRKNFKYYFMLIFTLFIVFVSNVSAEGKVMYMECDDYVIIYMPIDADMNISEYLVYKKDRVGSSIYNGPSRKANAKPMRWSLDDEETYLSKDEIFAEINKGNCPNTIKTPIPGYRYDYIFIGTKKGSNVVKFDKAKYNIYKHSKSNDKYLISGYTNDAAYFSFIYNSKNKNIEDGNGEEYLEFLNNLGEKENKSNFFKDFKPNKDYDLFKSSSTINSDIDSWLNNNNSPYQERKNALDKLNNMTNLNEKCTKINNEEDLSEDELIQSSELIKELEEAINLLKIYTSEPGKEFSRCSNPNEKVDADVSFIDCAYNMIIEEKNNSGGKFLGTVKSKLLSYLKTKSPSENSIKEKKDFYNNCYVNISENEDITSNLSEEEKTKLESLKEGFDGLYDDHAPNVIVNCESLLDENMKAKLKEYINVIKIAIPIIIIALGIVDFAKAIFTDDDAEMKKAQKQFLTRLFIAILIFFTPILVDLLLRIANEVWKDISPNSCGIF